MLSAFADFVREQGAALAPKMPYHEVAAQLVLDPTPELSPAPTFDVAAAPSPEASCRRRCTMGRKQATSAKKLDSLARKVMRLPASTATWELGLRQLGDVVEGTVPTFLVLGDRTSKLVIGGSVVEGLDPDEVAEFVMTSAIKPMALHAARPRRVIVASAELAAALRGRLAPLRIAVEEAPVPFAEEMLDMLHEHLTPPTDLPGPEQGPIYRAFVRIAAAEPWSWASDRIMTLERRSGPPLLWRAAAFGLHDNGTRVLALFHDEGDALAGVDDAIESTLALLFPATAEDGPAREELEARGLPMPPGWNVGLVKMGPGREPALPSTEAELLAIGTTMELLAELLERCGEGRPPAGAVSLAGGGVRGRIQAPSVPIPRAPDVPVLIEGDMSVLGAFPLPVAFLRDLFANYPEVPGAEQTRDAFEGKDEVVVLPLKTRAHDARRAVPVLARCDGIGLFSDGSAVEVCLTQGGVRKALVSFIPRSIASELLRDITPGGNLALVLLGGGHKRGVRRIRLDEVVAIRALRVCGEPLDE